MISDDVNEPLSNQGDGMNQSSGSNYITKKELKETTQELFDKIESRVSKKEFRSEMKRVDSSIEMLVTQVSKNTLEIKTLRGDMNDRFLEIDNRFAEMNSKFHMVLTAIDGLSGQIKDMSTEKAAGEHTFRRHENRLNNHETHLEKLDHKNR